MRRQRKVAAFTNPNAGKNTPRAGLGRVVASILTTPSWVYDTRTLEELEERCEGLRRSRPDTIVVIGGDGTVHQTLTRIIREYQQSGLPMPQILIIPTGTMNTVATTLGLTRHPAVRLAELISAKIRENRPFDHVHLAPLKVNDEYGFLYGSGIVVNFLEEYYRDHNRGTKRAVKVILGSLLHELGCLVTFRKPKNPLMRQVHAKITLPDGNEPPVAPFMTHTGIMVGAVDQIGMGCKGLPDARSRPGTFMLRDTALSFWGLAANLGMLWAGMPMPKTYDVNVSRLVVDYEQPTVTQIDGDIKAPTTRDVIECGPTLSFITG
ncbi:MAG TPA: diacylglycerol kinase family protein [Patescibacteria group bacterium]|nr:diacylglycerol kinase family protein [Patescibacteria group bacterium]